MGKGAGGRQGDPLLFLNVCGGRGEVNSTQFNAPTCHVRAAMGARVWGWVGDTKGEDKYDFHFPSPSASFDNEVPIHFLVGTLPITRILCIPTYNR